jgi:hypothetical protein
VWIARASLRRHGRARAAQAVHVLGSGRGATRRARTSRAQPGHHPPQHRARPPRSSFAGRAGGGGGRAPGSAAISDQRRAACARALGCARVAELAGLSSSGSESFRGREASAGYDPGAAGARRSTRVCQHGVAGRGSTPWTWSCQPLWSGCACCSRYHTDLQLPGLPLRQRCTQLELSTTDQLRARAAHDVGLAAGTRQCAAASGESQGLRWLSCCSSSASANAANVPAILPQLPTAAAQHPPSRPAPEQAVQHQPPRQAGALGTLASGRTLAIAACRGVQHPRAMVLLDGRHRTAAAPAGWGCRGCSLCGRQQERWVGGAGHC